MSLKPSNDIPVENYSVVQPSENGTEFVPLSKMRFRIPAHLGYVDFHTSYLTCDFEVQNANGKVEFSNDMGCDILLRSWRVLIGGHIVEEIDHPNVLLKTIKYDYGMDLGQDELNQLMTKNGSAQAYQGLNKSDPTINITTDSPSQKVKLVFDLKFSGIFGSTQTFPVGMTGDVEIEVVLEEPRRCLQYTSALHTPNVIPNIAHGAVVSQGVPIANLASGAAITEVDFGDTDQAVYYPEKVSKVDLQDCPFNIGQSARLMGIAADNSQYHPAGADITNITEGNGVNPVKVAIASADPGQAISGCRIRANEAGPLSAGGYTWEQCVRGTGNLTYTVSVPNLVLQVVAPPPQYVEQQAQKVAQEGYSIDIPTYTCYKSNTYDGVSSTTLEIPCYASRAKSLLCIGVEQQDLGGNNLLNSPYKMVGQYNDLQQYQFQIGERREPVRPVVCSNLSTFQHNVAQEQLTELEKGLRAGGCNVRSLRNYRSNFVISRALSAYGGTIPLTMRGARVYLEYLQTNKRPTTANPGGEPASTYGISNKNWFNYCHHIRRMIITPQGVQVMY